MAINSESVLVLEKFQEKNIVLFSSYFSTVFIKCLFNFQQNLNSHKLCFFHLPIMFSAQNMEIFSLTQPMKVKF